VAQSLYWQTGMLTYLAPLALLTVYLGVFVYALRRHSQGRILRLLFIVIALLAFIAGGFSEPYAALQIGGLSMLAIISILYAPPSFRRAALMLAIAGVMGAILAFSIVVLAPGNKSRVSTLPPPPPLASVIKSSAVYTLYFIETHTRRSRGVTLLSLVFPAWLAFVLHYWSSKNTANPLASSLRIGTVLKMLVLFLVGGFILIVVCFVPGFHALSEALPLRAHIVPKFVLTSLIVCWSFLAGLALWNAFATSRKLKWCFLLAASATVVVLLLISPLAAARRTLALGSKASLYASKWDVLDKEISAAKNMGATDLTIPKIDLIEWELGFGRPDLQPSNEPTAGQNRCLAKYYGLNSITAK
jgi:hypothetical protein